MADQTADPKPAASVKADALQFPIGYKAGVDSYRRTAAIVAESKSLLGTAAAYIRNQTTYLFVTGDQRCLLLFPKWHEKSGQSRYTWTDRGDGVKLGTLVDGAADAVGWEDPRPI